MFVMPMNWSYDKDLERYILSNLRCLLQDILGRKEFSSVVNKAH